jgi:hypothetical protein
MTISSLNILIDAQALQKRIISLMNSYIVQFYPFSIQDETSDFLRNTRTDLHHIPSTEIVVGEATNELVIVYVNAQSRKFAEDFYSYLEQRQIIEPREKHDFMSEILYLIDCNRENIQGKEVIVLHNIVEHENTILEIEETIRISSPNSICSISLLCPHNIDCKADFIGFTIPTDRIVGYGLSWKGHFQQLYHISTVS